MLMVTGSSRVEAGTTGTRNLDPTANYVHMDHLASDDPSLASISDLPSGGKPSEPLGANSRSV
jgi:hypothetical protein